MPLPLPLPLSRFFFFFLGCFSVGILWALRRSHFCCLLLGSRFTQDSCVLRRERLSFVFISATWNSDGAALICSDYLVASALHFPTIFFPSHIFLFFIVLVFYFSFTFALNLLLFFTSRRVPSRQQRLMGSACECSPNS